ncbi:MAG: DUF2235 domain-containing protein [Pseudomonadota bacterium]
MKRIVILCDGTWNSPDIEDTTHLPELALALETSSRQVVKYFSGVGVNDDARFSNIVTRGVNRVLGGATGYGLGAKVKAAYAAIAEIYEPDDEIYLFGFSRGAFTARSVAGMIRKCGIIDDLSKRGIRRAFRLYRKRGEGNAPDAPGIQAARAAMSTRFATSQDDSDARATPVPIVNIAYLGVWDTVGARGIPTALFGAVASLWNRQYQFHDTTLSRLVRSARHAVAADEQRRFYEPALWDNVDRLSGSAPPDDAPYQQRWFVGDHSIVGGSAKTDALSVFPKLWVVEGAPDLTWRPGKAPGADGADHRFATRRLIDPGGFYKLALSLLDWRRDPTEMTRLHDSTAARLRDLPDYRPESLARFF